MSVCGQVGENVCLTVFYSMIYPSIRSFIVKQFCVCFCPSVCLLVRILSVYVSVRPCVRPSACMHILYDIVCYFISSYVSFQFVRSSERPSALSSSVRIIMHVCKSVVYKHVRDIPYF